MFLISCSRDAESYFGSSAFQNTILWMMASIPIRRPVGHVRRQRGGERLLERGVTGVEFVDDRELRIGHVLRRGGLGDERLILLHGHGVLAFLRGEFLYGLLGFRERRLMLTKPFG